MSNDIVSEIEAHGPLTIIARVDRSEKMTNEEALELSRLFSVPSDQMKSLGTTVQDMRSATIGYDQRLISNIRGPEKIVGTIAYSPRVRLYPKLGIAIGVVGNEELASVLDHSRLSRISHAVSPTKISPIEGVRRSANLPSTYHEVLRVPQLWSLGLRGRGVTVGHLDTGIDTSHPDLSASLNEFIEYDFNGKPVQNSVPRDSDLSTGHGTHSAGIIAGRNLGNEVYGTAPASKLDCALVLGGGDELLRMVGGLEWIANGTAKIVNGSMGLPGEAQSFNLIMERLRELDILPVIAIGNEGEFSSRAPGNSNHALSVGACDENGIVLPGSSSQEISDPARRIVPTVIAPGLEVLSCSVGGGSRRLSGTSQAAPFVAGICALLKEAMPSATATDIETVVKLSATRNAGVTEARGNYGVPNALKAYSILTGTSFS